MKTIEQAKADLWKRFRNEVTEQISLKDEDLLRLMTDGVIFIRVAIMSDGSPMVRVMTKDAVKADPR